MEGKDFGVNVNKIKEAREAIKPFIKKTDLKYSDFFSSLCKGKIFLKLENTQFGNSFKARGANNKMLHLTPEEKEKGIITASSGNHGIATATIAKKMSLPAKIVIPATTPQKQIDAINQYDAELVLYGPDFPDAEQKALELASEEGKAYISPYNDSLVIAGQGTIGLEILEDFPEVEIVLVPIGGGGLLSGIATLIKNINPLTEVIGVQPVASPVWYESLKAGKLIEMKVQETICGGLSGNVEKGSITFPIIQKYVREVILVKEDTIREAVRLLWEKDNQVVEPSGAVGLAVLIENKKRFKDKKVVAVVTGGNIDDNLFKGITGFSVPK